MSQNKYKTFIALGFALLFTTCLNQEAVAKIQTSPKPEAAHAKNVILFIGDGMGLSSLDAAIIYAYQKPQALNFFKMPHMALVDTTSTSHWVTDAGAASTAMATGLNTANRMVSFFPGQDVHTNVKTLLDYAETRGLSTGGVLMRISPIRSYRPIMRIRKIVFTSTRFSCNY